MAASTYFSSWDNLWPVMLGLFGSGTLVSIDVVLQRMVHHGLTPQPILLGCIVMSKPAD